MARRFQRSPQLIERVQKLADLCRRLVGVPEEKRNVVGPRLPFRELAKIALPR
jgi:hypothetical protein